MGAFKRDCRSQWALPLLTVQKDFALHPTLQLPCLYFPREKEVESPSIFCPPLKKFQQEAESYLLFSCLRRGILCSSASSTLLHLSASFLILEKEQGST